MNKRLLVLAPHPDDELLIAGALIYTLKKKHYDITVAYFTNGDSSSGQGIVRIQEAIDALNVLGVREKDIQFLGYGNGWKNGKHLYNLPDGKEGVSYADKRETYCIEGHPEYRMLKSGKHHRYTRQNAKEDIRELLLDIRADIIICVDFDSHADHRALSLFFEEAMADILRNNGSYTPIVLKKFAYAGMGSAKWDYYYSPMPETQPGFREELFDQRYECDNPVFVWNDRIQLKIHRRTRTRHISSNILYKAALKHKSQKFHNRVGTFANADMVYWQRRTDSISYQARITATSGRADYVNDFKMIDCPDILCGLDGVGMLKNCAWIPDRSDSIQKLFLDFQRPVRVSKVHLYENFLPHENILKAQLTFDTGLVVDIRDIDHKGRKTEVIFDTQYDVKHMEFQILESEGAEYGLTELEIYEDDNEQDIPLELYKSPKKKSRNIENDLDILWERKRHNIVINHTKDSWYYRMYHLLIKWNAVGNDRLVRWLQQKQYKNAAIYGMGDLGRKLNHDLKTTDICVKYAMDQYAGSMTADIPVVCLALFADMPEVDVVIVTVTQSYKSIKKDLISNGCNAAKIVSLQQILDEAIYI
ncbi:PIG-L family deacetylase [Schaedlerella arabinosiphila]|jgi:LmbE family N-acetylglucosaminyl deacetylase|uniref:PIG-L family deacetylase n=1 Tax=Schaedlerella arabinosiphila TaxID=2044587 RepID=A0A9X5H651_9FIRM|nr:PIG-L family deacetylase [Schaedlerella arabinosiphila]KAI4441743.1 hypothetical protein C824_004252 [Schaedlerella arabinosiphila]NDO68695.1 PIG-L family deacetylase [Schaedlerella arabinosiphila]